MAEKAPNQATAAQRFWDVFKACLEENRVRPDHSPFYVKWAQAFVDFIPGKKLRDRSREDIELFLPDQLLKMSRFQYGTRSNFCQRIFERRQNATIYNGCLPNAYALPLRAAFLSTGVCQMRSHGKKGF